MGDSLVMGGTYYVEKIVDKKFVEGNRGPEPHYLVKWLGFPESENSWEPLENLNNCPDVLAEFEAKYAAENPIPIPEPTVKIPDNTRFLKEKKDLQDDSDFDDDCWDEAGEALIRFPKNIMPSRVVGAMERGGHLIYAIVVVKKTNPNEECFMMLIRSKSLKEAYPQVLIKWLEEHVNFSDDPRSQPEIASSAYAALAEDKDSDEEDSDPDLYEEGELHIPVVCSSSSEDSSDDPGSECKYTYTPIPIVL